MNKELENEIVDLGVATVETRGTDLFGIADIDHQGVRNPLGGIADE